MNKKVATTVVAVALTTVSLAGCRVTVNGNGQGTVTKDPAPTSAPSISPTTAPPEPSPFRFQGDLGLDRPFTVVVRPDNVVDLAASTVPAGEYQTAGEVDGGVDGSCKFVLYREVPVSATTGADVLVKTPDAVLPPRTAPVQDEATVVASDTPVKLEVGQKFAAVGCQEFVETPGN